MIRLLPNSFAYNWNSTPGERSANYPCDRYLSDPDDVLFRALSIAAEKSTVFRWLCQLRVAPYSYDWIDNQGRRSPWHLDSGLENLAVGQSFMEIFRLAEFARDEHITMTINDDRSKRVFGEIALSYVVASVSAAETRLIVKLVIRRPNNSTFAWMGPLLPWGDLIMMRKQLLTIKELSERSPKLVK